MDGPRVVVVTGASAGLGRAIARIFGARGAAIGLIARGRDGLGAAEREIRDAGGRALALPADVADADALLVEAVDILRRAYPQGHPDLANALRRLSIARQRELHERPIARHLTGGDWITLAGCPREPSTSSASAPSR